MKPKFDFWVWMRKLDLNNWPNCVADTYLGWFNTILEEMKEDRRWAM